MFVNKIIKTGKHQKSMKNEIYCFKKQPITIPASYDQIVPTSVS